jgi:hypothetical protein
MKRLLIALLLIGTTSLAQTIVASERDEEDEARKCVRNFTEDGSFFKGKTYRTWQEYSGLSYDGVFRSVAQAVVAENWGDVNADKDLGIISAGQAVTMGQGSIAPLSVVVKEKPSGEIRVEATFGTAGGQKAATKAVRKGLCKLVEAPGEDSTSDAE